MLLAASIVLYVFFYKIIDHRPSLSLLKYSSVNSKSWYVGYYFLVIVIARLFLNDFLARLDKKGHLMLAAVTFALIQFSWSRGVINNLSGGLDVMCTGIFLYSLGGYIRKYNPFDKIKTWAVIAAIVGLFAIVLTDFYIATADNIIGFNPDGDARFIQSIPGYGNHEFIPVCLGIAFFEMFRRMQIKSSRLINFLGASTFMVYLLHDNSFFYKLWDKKDWIGALHNNIIDFTLSYVLWVVGIFAFGALVYFVFQIFGRIIEKCQPLVIKNNTVS